MMKKIYYLTLIGLLFSSVLFAQKRRRGCANPLSTYAFQQKFNDIQRQLNEEYKLKAAINMVRTNCITSSQVTQVTAAFASDQSRIAFVKEAYPKTYDRNRFHQVYAAFKRFRNVAKAHAYIMTLRQGGSTGGNGGNGNPSLLSFPHWNYPVLTGYTGANNCNAFLNNTMFMGYANQIHQQSNETDKYSRAWQTLTSNCVTTAQVMKLVSLVSQDNNRLALLKGAYARVYDVDNYAAARVALRALSAQEEFDRFLAGKGQVKKEEVCLIDDKDFSSVNNQVKKEWVGSKKMSLVQSIFKTKEKCYSIAQLKTIGKQFTFAREKMKFVQWAYNYAHKKQDYHQMADIFRSTFDKRDFTAWLNKQK